jgi:hypothetical protein
MNIFRLILIALLFYGVGCAPALKAYYPGTYYPEDHTYQNKALDFSLTFRGNWEIITELSAMKDNQETAHELHRSGSELLFIGYTVEQTQGTRCIASNLNESARLFAENIRNVNKADLDADSGLTEDTINGVGVTVWRYTKGGFCFVEYFFDVDTYDIRVAFWSKPRLFENFLPVYNDIIGSLSFGGSK